MSRDQDIWDIENLYPADSEYQETSAIGRELQAQAGGNLENWRDESDSVIARYAQLCRQRHLV